MHVIYLPLGRGKFALVDSDCPFNLLSQKWSLNTKNPGRHYAYRARKESEPRKPTHFFLHSEILGESYSQEVDHKNGDTLDNCRKNLRRCSHLGNGRNLRKWITPTSSKFKGVSSRHSGWRAYISSHGTQKHLGVFQKEEEAARAYDKAAKSLFGEFARLNFPT